MMRESFPTPKREIKKICRISFGLHNHFAIVGYDPEKGTFAESSFYFQNDYTKLPNEFGACPESMAKKLFGYAKSILSDLLANCEERRMEIYQNDALFVTITLQDGTEKKYSWCNPIVGEVWELLKFNEFTYFGDFDKPLCMLFSYCCSGVNLQEIRKQIKTGEIFFSEFYNERVYPMFAKDDYWDAKLTINADNSVKIQRELYAETLSEENGILIDPEGMIVRDGGLAYVKALKENGVRIILDPERIKTE